MQLSLSERNGLRVRGRLRVQLMFDEPGLLTQRAVVVYDGHNDLTDLAAEIYAGIVAGDPDSLLSVVAIGSGAFMQPDGTPSDTLVPPVPTETELRAQEAATGIANRVSSGTSATFTAVFRPTEAVGALVNEFGLFTKDGRMFSHAVDTSLAVEGDSKVKSGIAYLLIEWTLDLTIT